MAKPYQDEDWLRKRWFSSKSVSEIAEEVGRDPSTITRYARKFGFPHKYDASPWQDEETLRRLYHDEGMSLQEVADHLDCSATTVRDNMDACGIDRRSLRRSQALSRPQIQHWYDSAGYEQVCAEVNGENRTALVHQLVAIANGADPHRMFGGELATHHENGCKWDNRPSNITTMTTEEHGKMHAEKQLQDGEAWHQK